MSIKTPEHSAADERSTALPTPRQAPAQASGQAPVLGRERYSATAGRVQLTGVQALARLPIEQHRLDVAKGLNVGTFISGYEGSPLAGYDLELGRIRDLLTANDVSFVPGLNEEAAATSVQGSQLAATLPQAARDGVLGIWYGKAPGLDRATDALRHANIMGAHPKGGALVLVGDDPAAKSSSVPCASEFAFVDLAMPFLYPADSAEVLDLGLHAIELSRVSGLWVGFKIVTHIADGTSTVDLGAERPEPVLPRGSHQHQPSSQFLMPTLGRLERDLLTTRLRLAREYSRLNGLNKVVGRGNADRVGIVAAGHTWRDLLGTLARLGISEADLEASPLRLFKIGMPWPLDEETVREFAEGLDEVIVVEEKRSFLEAALRDVLYGVPGAPRVIGKTDVDGSELFPAYSDLDVDTIGPRLHRRLTALGVPVGPDPDAVASNTGGRLQLPLASRVPYFCSGCPHNTSTKPHGAELVGAGIGCHAMVLFMDESQVGNVTGLAQMGGEGLQWIGMAPFVSTGHYLQNLGDGTFDHSGSLAIRAAVAAGVNITYKLLFNSAVAMTGGQQAVAGMDVRQIVDVLRAEKVAKIIVTTDDVKRTRKAGLPRDVEVMDRSRMAEAQAALAKVPGTTVLLHDQECATEKRRKRKRGMATTPQTRVVIDERVCEGCGDCGRKSNCLSVQPVASEFGRKTRIHQDSCNTDFTCLTGDCPAFVKVTVPAGAQAAKRPMSEIVAGIPVDDLPAPEVVVGADEFGVRLTGVGGTGVVTVSHVLALAGQLTGWTTRSLDMTGLAQKGGAVVSDIRFSRTDGTTNKLAAGDCDLYLGCDLLVAAEEGNLKVTSPERTIAVLSTTEVPTGFMVSDPDVVFPIVAEAVNRVTSRVRTSYVLDARQIAATLLGDDQYANIFLVGIGFQSGALALPAVAIEDAITANGVAVEANLAAFRLGRLYAVDQERVLTAYDEASAMRDENAALPGETELDRVVRLRKNELTAYQDEAYAEKFATLVETIRRRETEIVAGSTALTFAVATGLHKLMAYKDEYEVARLLLLPETGQSITEQFGAAATSAWQLHPPALRALGLKKKISLGPWARPVLVLLAWLKFLRGTRLDLFGRAHVRVVERELLADYIDLLGDFDRALAPENLDLAVQLAALPDLVRGYEHVKLRNVERYREERSELLARFALESDAGRTE